LNLFLVEPGGIDHDAEAVVQAMADVATIGLLRSYSRDDNQKLHDVARDIVRGVLSADRRSWASAGASA